jgi:hypothetical protein
LKAFSPTAIRDADYSAPDIFKVLLITWFALLVIFNLFPQIDQEISAHFFTREACNVGVSLREVCGHFLYRQEFTLQVLRTLFLRLPYIAAFVLLWKLIDCYGHFGATFDAERARRLKIALGSLIAGPIVLVNFILKDHWGRPRPFSTTDFGGALDFVPAGSTAGKCLSNCSFVSGESAGAGWLLCLHHAAGVATRAIFAAGHDFVTGAGIASGLRRALSVRRYSWMVVILRCFCRHPGADRFATAGKKTEN